ncbi:MAG: ATPase domain-containing protein, partial [Candidatus Hydrogenedentota bacterium]
PAEVELPRTIESMLAVVEEVSPTRVVLDSMAELRAMAQNELWYRRQLMTLKNHFADRDCSVLIIEIPADHETLNSVASGVLEMQQVAPLYGPDRRKLRVSKVRGRDFTTGHHDYKIRTGGIDVFPRLVAAEHRRRFKREVVATGLEELDTMLDGGLVRGTSTLLIGTSGTGKSLVATQLAVAAAERGERSAMYVFDERVQTLLQRAEGVGLPLEQHIDEGTIEVRQVDPAELTPGEFSDLLKTSVEKEGIRLVIIDSLNGYAYAMPEERSLCVHLHELSSYLNQQAVTSVYVMTQHGMLSEGSVSPFHVSYISDTVVLFRHFEFGGEIHKALAVYKSRASAHESFIRELKISSEGLVLGPPLTEFRGVLAGTPIFLGETLHGDPGDTGAGRG